MKIKRTNNFASAFKGIFIEVNGKLVLSVRTKNLNLIKFKNDFTPAEDFPYLQSHINFQPKMLCICINCESWRIENLKISKLNNGGV